MTGSSLFSSLGSFSSISSATSSLQTFATLQRGPRNVGAVSAYDGPQPSAATVCQPNDGLHRSIARPSAAAGQAARERAALKQRAADAAVVNTHATPKQSARARAPSCPKIIVTAADAPPTSSSSRASNNRPGGESASREHTKMTKGAYQVGGVPHPRPNSALLGPNGYVVVCSSGKLSSALRHGSRVPVVAGKSAPTAKFVHFIARKPVAKAAAPARPQFKAGFLNSVSIPSFCMDFTL